jgi:serine/threonine protein kinase
MGNVFIDAVQGKILICDNDNVAVNKKGKASIQGTPRFIAPEVVMGDAMPSTQTDLFSLAVLLFYFFMLHHPFEGKLDSQIHCLDSFAVDELYGRNPVFIFDPTNHSNEPDPKFHRRVMSYWKLYPQFLRDMFIRAFTVGIRDPMARIQESEWRSELARVQDCIIYCQECGAENFFDPAAVVGTHCWNPQCGVQVRIPLQLKIDNRWVTLNHDRKIVKHHLDGTSYDFTRTVGEVAENPKIKGMWGIKNLSTYKWVVSLPDGKMWDVEPGKSIGMVPGSKISFGKVEGEIMSQGQNGPSHR